MNKKENLTNEIEKILSEREIEKKSRILAEKELNITKKELQITQQDLQNLQQRMNPNMNTAAAGPTSPNPDQDLINQNEPIIEMTPIINQQQRQPQQQQIQKKHVDPGINKKQIAYQIYKDSKATIIICLLAMVMPFITLLVAMISIMFAMIAAVIAMIYPCLVLVRMISIQSRLNKKYGFKPLLPLAQRQPRYPRRYPQQPPPYQQQYQQQQYQQNMGGDMI